MKRSIISMLLVTILLLCSCGSAGPSPVPSRDAAALYDYFIRDAAEVTVTDGTVTFTDAAGVTMTLDKQPQSVAILYSSLTTLWYECGGVASGTVGGDSAAEVYLEYIGRDVTEDPQVATLALNAAGSSWSVESIIASRPDLIICSTAMNGYGTIAAPAAAADIPVVAADYDDLCDYLKWFYVFCNLNSQPELWDIVAMPVLEQVIETVCSVPDTAPRVFCMFAKSKGLQANTSGTVVGQMISQLGGINIADGTDTAAERIDVNLEAVYAADPDVIVIQCHAEPEEARQTVERVLGDDPLWLSLRAVREGRVFYLDKSLFHNKPNRRFAEAYALLAELMYTP